MWRMVPAVALVGALALPVAPGTGERTVTPLTQPSSTALDCGPANGACLVQQAVPVNALGQPWVLHDVTYIVDWVARPEGYPGRPGRFVEVTVHVDNKGKDDAYYPDPVVEYEGTRLAAAGWTQPFGGAMIGPGRSGDFRSAFPAPNPGGVVLVRVLAYVGETEMLVHWAGIDR